MNAVTAVEIVNLHLSRNETAEAQRFVMNVERDHCLLPSSLFERVLRAAIRTDTLAPEYLTFCKDAFGKATLAEIMST